MARLTNRPSTVVSSPYPSATPDRSLSDQENMDPGEAMRDKGKQRAEHPTPPTLSIRDGATAHTTSHKRRRTTTDAPPLSEEDLVYERFVRIFDPEQDPDERREVKRQYRELEKDLHNNREELLQGSGARLTETITEANKIFENVKQTNDACPDSRLLVNVGDLAYRKSAALVSGDTSIGVDVDEFLSKCLSYMRNQGGPSASENRPVASQRLSQTQRRYNDEEEDDTTVLQWDLLGRQACYRHNSRPPIPSFLLGPLSRAKKQRAQVQRRARQARDNTREARPEALTGQDLTQSGQNSLTAQCEAMSKHIKRHIRKAAQALRAGGIITPAELSTAEGSELLKQHHVRMAGEQLGLPLFEYVVNPHSFGQTVENLFHISFLIKEGTIGLELDSDALPVLYSATAHTLEEQRSQQINKHQAVLALDYKTWQDLIAAYGITTSMIAHREESHSTQLGSRGWYS